MKTDQVLNMLMQQIQSRVYALLIFLVECVTTVLFHFVLQFDEIEAIRKQLHSKDSEIGIVTNDSMSFSDSDLSNGRE